MNAPVVKKESITKKLLVVGSDEIGLSRVEEFLNSCDIPSAKSLVKEGIKAEEISQVLLKAHGVQADGKHMQLCVDQVWNGLAMDLMMSNIDQDLWMWKDKDALSLLEYWKSLDSTLSFILVYNAPNKLFEELLQHEATPTIEELEEELQVWNAYNRELLNFYYRNQDRCILVNSEQIRGAAPTKLLEVGKEIGLDIESKHLTFETIKENSKEINKYDDLFVNLVNTFTQNYPAALALYDELQSSANLPYQQTHKQEISVYGAITSYVHIKKTLQEKEQALKVKNSQLREYVEKLQYVETEKVFQNEENELLLAQLHSVQEELEKKYLETQKIEKILQKEKQDVSQLREKLKKVENEKLSKDAKQLKELEEENELLLAQLHSVQEELERQYLKNVEQQKKKESQRYYGAADRIKQQLSYRLGAKMIEDSKSSGGVILMPFTLYGEVKRYRKEQKTRQKLPPIHKYADAYEAERVKKHLSYKLGSAMVESMKSPFGVFKLPFALKTAHKEYKKEKSNVSK
jgi:hypothetical protein